MQRRRNLGIQGLYPTLISSNQSIVFIFAALKEFNDEDINFFTRFGNFTARYNTPSPQ
jgi:hypothetical protein